MLSFQPLIPFGFVKLPNSSNPIYNKLVIVDDVNKFPTPIGSTITLENDTCYLVTTHLDLNGLRLIGGENNAILGTSSETSSLTSTGLISVRYLISSQFTLAIRHITFKNVTKCVYIDGTSSGAVLDWTGVNFENIPEVGRIISCNNFIFSKGAFLGCRGLVFTGTINTINFDQTLFTGDGAAGDIITLDANCTITRRFRIIFSSFAISGSTGGINVNASSTIPNEAFILFKISFTGSTEVYYLPGISYLDNRCSFTDCDNITNSAILFACTMENNTTETVINTVNTYTKLIGITIPNSLNQKFEHDNNKGIVKTPKLTPLYIDSVITVESVGGPTVEIGLAIFKNGVLVPGSNVETTTNANSKAENVSLHAVSQGSDNDYFEVYGKNITNATNLIATTLNTIITKLI
jgi:hypothetical protein